MIAASIDSKNAGQEIATIFLLVLSTSSCAACSAFLCLQNSTTLKTPGPNAMSFQVVLDTPQGCLDQKPMGLTPTIFVPEISQKGLAEVMGLFGCSHNQM